MKMIGIERDCPVCGLSFIPRRDYREKRFCSLKCWYSSGQKAKNRKCRECGKTFNSKHNLMFCGKECFAARSIRRRTSNCIACGKEFVKERRTSTVKHCSRACMGISARDPLIHFTCLHCGKQSNHRGMGERKRKFCSTKCQYAYNVADNSPLYRGNRRHSRGATWPRQSKIARERDGNTCQGCGAVPNERASIDHIVPFRLTVVYAQTDGLDPNDPRNLIALCRSCHGKKTQAENKLLAGDLIGFLSAIRSFLPIGRVEAALDLWGLGRKKKQTLPFEPVPLFARAARGIARRNKEEIT
jgi:endogenous inhibitor of DNA gyrase (YacG/DUF329 family)